MSLRGWVAGCAVFLHVLALSNAAEPVRWRVVPLDGNVPSLIRLPPLAVAGPRDTRNDAWQQSGQMGGNYRTICQDFRVCLDQQGWVLQKVIPVSYMYPVSELTLWSRGETRVLLMIWEMDAATCGFSWGELKE